MNTNTNPQTSANMSVSAMIGELKLLDDKTLLQNTRLWAMRERRDTLIVLHHLAEIERRGSYAKLNCASLWEYCTKELGYSESAAYRRIASMRLLREVPSVETKLNSGELNLSVLAQAAKFFKQEQKAGATVTTEKKKQVLNLIEGKSARQAERELLALSSQPANTPKEESRAVSQNLTQIRFNADAQLMKDFEQIRGLLVHKHPLLSLGEMMKILAQMALEKLDPARQKTRPKMTTPPARRRKLPTEHADFALKLPTSEVASETKSRAKDPRVATRRQRREIFGRDQSRCTWVNPKTGARCDSRFKLEVVGFKTSIRLISSMTFSLLADGPTLQTFKIKMIDSTSVP